MNINISLYHVFAAVRETGSISGAARRLYISQPAVSKSIRTLEEELQTKLFIRNSKGVTLTEDGRILYDHVKEAFRYLESGEAEIQRRTNMGIGHLIIGVSTTLCRYKLLPDLRGFTSLYPNISITIQCQPTLQTLSLIRSDAIDIGMVARQKNFSDLEFCNLGKLEDVFVATPEYLQNLQKRTGAEGIGLLSRGTLMLLNNENATRQYVNYFLEEKHIHPYHMIESTTMDLLIEFARTGLGIACVIRDFVRKDLEDGSLVEIDAGYDQPPRDVGLAWQKSKENERALELFLDYVNSSPLS